MISHLTNQEGNLELSRSPGPLMAVGMSSAPPTNSREATLYPEPLIQPGPILRSLLD